MELQVALHLACDKLEMERQNRVLLAALRCHGVYSEAEHAAPERTGPVVVVGPSAGQPPR